MALRGGAGGYGGITSLNTDQKESPYHPHQVLSKVRDYKENKVFVKCLTCGQTWSHPIGDMWGYQPEECLKNENNRS